MDSDPISDKYATLEDPGIRRFMIEGERLYPAEAVSFTIAQQRAFYDVYSAHFATPRPASVAVQDFLAGTIPCRRYVPRLARGPSVLYLHGGGFILGGIDSHDSICADLAAQSGVMVVAVQYRLAPEHPFPAAFEDCLAVLHHLTSDGSQVIVAGDSAGGNLAAALCLKARDDGVAAIKAQVLIYPGLGGDMRTGSYVTQAQAPGLTTADVKYYHEIYGGHGDKYAWPLLETDFQRLPPAFVVAASLDSLRDDSFTYVSRLTAAGVDAALREEPLLVHAFLRARSMSEPAAASFKAVVAAVRRFAA
jgi:acetyl esterase